MRFVKGKSDQQLPFFVFLTGETIGQDKEIRRVDLFFDRFKLKYFGLHKNLSENKGQRYCVSDLRKLDIYCYVIWVGFLGILEKEFGRYTEVRRRMNGIVADQNGILYRRKDNLRAPEREFKAAVEMASDFNFIGKTLLEGKNKKFLTQNAKKKKDKKGKKEGSVFYIDTRREAYDRALVEKAGDIDKKKTYKRN